MNPTGKNIVITGAGDGIGKALVNEFASKYNANVHAIDIEPTKLEKLKLGEKKYGHQIFTYTADVTNLTALHAVTEEVVQNTGSIDIWINNAGINRPGSFLKTPPETTEKIIQTNLNGLINGTYTSLTHMAPHANGCIVNIASIAGHVPAPYMTAYVAAKHGVVGFTRSLQCELEFENSPIHLMLVSPGFVNTNIINQKDQLSFPDWLSWSLSTPNTVVKSICNGIKRASPEITPTINGKIMKKLYRHFPRQTVKGSKVLLTEKLSDVFLNRYIDP